MSPSTRIQRDNRSARYSGPNLGTVALHAVAAILSFVGYFRWRRYRSRPPARASEVQEDLYAEWLVLEHAVATGKTTREDAERYWRRGAR